MSSTRRATDGLFHQERFCSSPEFEGDAINGLAAAKRISIIKDRTVREVLWFVQWRSLVPGGLQQLCEELGTSFPEHVGTPTLRKLIGSKRRVVRQDEIRALRKECGIFDDDDEYFTPETIDRNGFVLPKCPAREFEVEFYQTRTSDALSDLPQILTAFCLDPKADVAKGVWFFSDLLGALAALRERFVSSARSRLADTIVTRRINETLDFWFSRRRMVLIEGVAGIGRSETARAWCDAHAGLVRYVEVPSSSDDRSFFASMARQLGVARGASFKSQYSSASHAGPSSLGKDSFRCWHSDRISCTRSFFKMSGNFRAKNSLVRRAIRAPCESPNHFTDRAFQARHDQDCAGASSWRRHAQLEAPSLIRPWDRKEAGERGHRST